MERKQRERSQPPSRPPYRVAWQMCTVSRWNWYLYRTNRLEEWMERTKRCLNVVRPATAENIAAIWCETTTGIGLYTRQKVLPKPGDTSNIFFNVLSLECALDASVFTFIIVSCSTPWLLPAGIKWIQTALRTRNMANIFTFTICDFLLYAKHVQNLGRHCANSQQFVRTRFALLLRGE